MMGAKTIIFFLTRAWCCRWFVSVAPLTLAILFCGCTKSDESASGPSNEVIQTGVVRVGDHVITENDVLQEAKRLRESGRPVPDKVALVNTMAEHAALVQQARRAGIDQDPGVKRDMDDLLIARWRDRDVKTRIDESDISDDTLKQLYEDRKDDFVTPANIRLAILKLGASPRMSAARRDELESRLAEARKRIIANPAPGGRGPAAMGFGALAIDYSDDSASRYRGGDIGWLEAGNLRYRWPRQVLETGYALPKGLPSQILREKDAYYLVMKTDERPAKTMEFEAVKSSLRNRLLIEQQNRLGMALHQEAILNFPADIDTARLDGLTLPVAHETSARGPAGTKPDWTEGDVAHNEP